MPMLPLKPLSILCSSTAPDDYTSIIRTVTFAPGQSEAFVPFSTLSDSVIEGTHSFSAVISNPSPGVTLGNSIATVDITEEQGECNPGNGYI